jgi:Na+-transporting NADH:ubiquinone oxidoreductase subunit C
MKQILTTMRFVLIMGLVTAGLLIAVDTLTFERILANQQALLQSKVLDGFEMNYQTASINDTFLESVDIVTVTVNGTDYEIYVDPSTGDIAFRFEGGGVWGPIIGVLTLESDLTTIRKVGILQQEETPGLGGRIVELPYLAKYVGVRFSPRIDITKDGAVSENQVDAISGATSTSNAFENILNDHYNSVVAAYQTTLGEE